MTTGEFTANSLGGAAPNSTKGLIEPGELARIYEDHTTRWALCRVVEGLIKDRVIDFDRGAHVIRLGEPAVYGALAEIQREAQTIVVEPGA